MAQTIDSLVTLLKTASDAYYNGKQSPLDDETFDTLMEELRSRDPAHPFLQTIGAPPSLTGSTPLPSQMASLDKIKPGMPALKRFLTVAPAYVVSEKLDGLSALWCPSSKSLYLRGDGSQGVSISPAHMQGLVPSNERHVIRGELLMPRATAALGRSIVNGILHQSTPDPEKLSKIQFLAYEVIEPAGLTRSAQFEWLAAKGFLTPWWQRLTALTEDQLQSLFLERRSKSLYETDGIVVGVDQVPHRTLAPIGKVQPPKNPKDCVAFKMPIHEQSAVTVVREVIWAPSAQGYVIPKLRFDPISVGGAVIEFCTAHNAKTVRDKKLGVGATVRIRRSGDVIPTLDEVLVPATDAPVLPPDGEWDANGVHIRLKTVSQEQTISQLHHFAKTLEIQGLGPASCRALVEGGLASPRAVWESTAERLSLLLGPKTGKTLYANLRALAPTEIQLCVASSLMPRGVGETKLTSLMASHPDPRLWGSCGLPATGWTAETFREFQAAYPSYEAWRKTLWFKESVQPVESSLKEQPRARALVCFTGFRDGALEEQLKAAGILISPTLTSKVSSLIVTDGAKPSEKTKKAAASNIEILTRAQCIQKYLS